MAILILVVLPGIVLELLRQRSRPGRADSVFVETARVLLGGVLVTAVTLVLLGLVRTLAPPVLADPRGLWSIPGYAGNHLWLTGWTICHFLLVSSTLSALCYSLAPAPGLTGGVFMESAWVTVFGRLSHRLREEQAHALSGQRIITQVQVELTDGSAYMGIRDAYSVDAANADRELVLAPPLQSRREGGQFEALDQGWQRIIIPSSEIRAIMVRFATAPEGPTPSVKVRGRWMAKTISSWTTKPGRLAIILAAEVIAPTAVGVGIHLLS